MRSQNGLLPDAKRRDRVFLPEEDQQGQRQGHLHVTEHTARSADDRQPHAEAVQDRRAAVCPHQPRQVNIQDPGHEARSITRQGGCELLASFEKR